MFTAYKIGVTVALTNQVSSILGVIARDFAKSDAQAVKLKQTLKEIKLLGLTGFALGGLGYAGFRVLSDIIKPASEYAHQLNIMNMAGMKQAEIATAVGDAWKNTSTVLTTTATQNLKTLLDLRNIIGEVNKESGGNIGIDAARQQLPVVSMIQAVMASSTEGRIRDNAGNFAFSLAKALDIIGAATSPEKFQAQAEAMSKVVTAFQGRVTPQQFQAVFQYARQAKYGLSDDFKYGYLPTLMLEASTGGNSSGGGSRGVGPQLAAFSRFWLQGYINKKAMPELEELGLIGRGTGLKTTTEGTTVNRLKGADLAAQNPYFAVRDVLLPAIERKFGGKATQEQIIQTIQEIGRGNQLATSLMLEFALKGSNFDRDRAIISGAMPYQQAYRQAMRNDPEFAYKALADQWENLKIAFGKDVIPIIIPAIISLTHGLNDFARWSDEHPRLTKDLVVSFAALSASLVFSGVVLTLTAAFKALRLALTLGGLIPAVFKLATAAGGAGTASTAGAAGLAGAAGTLGAAGAGAAAIASTSAYVLTGPMRQEQENRRKMISEMSPADQMAGIKNAIAGAKMDLASGNGAIAAGSDGRVITDAQADRIGDKIAAKLNGAAVHMDVPKLGSILFDGVGNSPPSGASNFDSRLNPLFPATGIK